MDFIRGRDRSQLTLLPEDINDLIGQDSPVRVIDAFIESLDLSLLDLHRPNHASTGRPPYDPKDLLKLYIYGYFNRIRSSRKLMAECSRNVELFFLINRLLPDFRTISDFRKDNSKAIKNVFKAFTKICIDLNLYERELVAIDGSKFRAVNNRKKMYNEKILSQKLVRIEENVEKYLSQLDKADETEESSSRYTAEEIQAKLAELKKRKELYQGYLRELKESDQTQKLTTDPEARMMKLHDGYGCCYNVQTAVDKGSHLIAEYEVTNECNDSKLLSKMANKAKEALEVDTIHAAADKGYDSQKEIEKCLNEGVIPHVGFQNGKEERLIVMDYQESEITEEDKKSSKHETIQKCLRSGVLPQCYEGSILKIEVCDQEQLSCFRRNADGTVTCPANCTLNPISWKKNGSIDYQNKKACRACKNKCTSSKSPKVVRFGPDTTYVPVWMYGALPKDILKYPTDEIPYNAFKKHKSRKIVVIHIKDDIPTQKLRLHLSEHPFGTVKWYHGAHYLLCKGIEKARGELGLSFICYNLRRAINMVGAQKLIMAMRG